MADEQSHYVVQVKIEGDEVRAVCVCGWESAVAASETKARKAHERHATDAART